jgi:hypothetical protein
MGAMPLLTRSGKRITRRMLLLDDGQRYFRCASPNCLRRSQWLHESEFYRLPNPLSACNRMSECKACNNVRRGRQRIVDRARRAYAEAR